MLPTRRREERGIFERGSPEHHTSGPGGEHAFQRGEIANAAANLDLGADRATDASDRVLIDRLPAEGTVEVDDVDPFGTGFLEAARDGDGILGVDGLARHVALHETHTTATLQIDRGK